MTPKEEGLVGGGSGARTAAAIARELVGTRVAGTRVEKTAGRWVAGRRLAERGGVGEDRVAPFGAVLAAALGC